VKDLSDIALLNLLKELDDRAAFNELYVRYWKVIFDIGSKKLRDNEMAEDLVHDLFVDLWNKRQQIVVQTSFVGYLYSMLNNRLIDEHRKVTYHRRVQSEIQHIAIDQDNGLFDSLASRDLEEHLMTEVENLPTGMKQIFLMSRQDYLSNSEIAEKLSISPQTVKNQISSAIKRLRIKELNLSK
jgi:RNA polymerase sigma-70 factor (family 1)